MVQVILWEGKPKNDAPRPVYRIPDLAVEECPRQQLERFGAQVLTTAELLAILLRVGVAGENAVQVGQRLLVEFNGLVGLHSTPFNYLCNQCGIGAAKAALVKAALGLGRRMAEEDPQERYAIIEPKDAAKLVAFDMSALEQEH